MDELCIARGDGWSCMNPILIKSTRLCRSHHRNQVSGKGLHPLRIPGTPRSGVCPVRIEDWTCERPVYLRGMCVVHGRQEKRGKPFGVIRTNVKVDNWFNERGEKLCTRCGAYRPTEEFSAATNRPNGLFVICKSCARSRHLLDTYGLTDEAYGLLQAAQESRCAICEVPQDELKRPLAVDHDHRCCPGDKSCGACIRGLLCSPCNRALGHFGDSPEMLTRAIRYLAKDVKP